MDLGNLHLDARLTRLSVLYTNAEFIWRMLMPQVGVSKTSDKYVVYTKEDLFRVADDAIAPNALPNEIEGSLSDDKYACDDHALSGWVTQESIDRADSPIKPLIVRNRIINGALDLTQENRVAGVVFSAATYPAGNKVQLAGTSQWGESADDPIGDVTTAVEGCFVRANTLVFGKEAWLKFRRLPEIIEAIRSKSPGAAPVSSGMVSGAEVAAFFEVDRVIVGRARKNTSNPGQTAAYADVWGKHMSALHVQDGVDLDSVAFGKTFVETDRTTYREFDGKRGVKGSHFLKVGYNSDEKVIAPDLGYFIEDAAP